MKWLQFAILLLRIANFIIDRQKQEEIRGQTKDAFFDALEKESDALLAKINVARAARRNRVEHGELQQDGTDRFQRD